MRVKFTASIAIAKSLPGEYDDNFHLRDAGGREFVLKVMHPARERSFIDLQCRALQHLEKHASSNFPSARNSCSER